MVQVIEQMDRGGRVGQALGEGLSSGLQLLVQKKMDQMNQDRKLRDQQQRFEQLQSLFGGQRPPDSFEEMFEAQGPQGGEVAGEVAFSPGQLIAAEQIYPGSGKILQEYQKQQKALSGEAASQKRLQSSIANMLKVLPSVGPGKIANRLTAEGRKKRQYFDSLAMNLEEQAATMVGKGTLSKPRFDFLLKNLPSSKKTQAANEGALKAWSETLGVEVPGLSDVGFEEESESIAEAPQGEKIVTKDIAL